MLRACFYPRQASDFGPLALRAKQSPGLFGRTFDGSKTNFSANKKPPEGGLMLAGRLGFEPR